MTLSRRSYAPRASKTSTIIRRWKRERWTTTEVRFLAITACKHESPVHWSIRHSRCHLAPMTTLHKRLPNLYMTHRRKQISNYSQQLSTHEKNIRSDQCICGLRLLRERRRREGKLGHALRAMSRQDRRRRHKNGQTSRGQRSNRSESSGFLYQRPGDNCH